MNIIATVALIAAIIAAMVLLVGVWNFIMWLAGRT